MLRLETWRQHEKQVLVIKRLKHLKRSFIIHLNKLQAIQDILFMFNTPFWVSDKDIVKTMKTY